MYNYNLNLVQNSGVNLDVDTKYFFFNLYLLMQNSLSLTNVIQVYYSVILCVTGRRLVGRDKKLFKLK